MHGYILTYSSFKGIQFVSSVFSIEVTLISASAVPHCGKTRENILRKSGNNQRGEYPAERDDCYTDDEEEKRWTKVKMRKRWLQWSEKGSQGNFNLSSIFVIIVRWKCL